MPFMRSESCSFIWHPKVVTWKLLAAAMGRFSVPAAWAAASVARRPWRALARVGPVQVSVGLLGRVGVLGDRGAVARRELVDRVLGRDVRSPAADHEDHAR